jgi:hypothetical protein
VGLIRADWFCSELKYHPVFEYAAQQHLHFDAMALAQRYGLPTGYVDITKSLEIALLFATCDLKSDGS